MYLFFNSVRWISEFKLTSKSLRHRACSKSCCSSGRETGVRCFAQSAQLIIPLHRAISSRSPDKPQDLWEMQLRPQQGICIWHTQIGLWLHLCTCMHYAQTVKWKAHLESHQKSSPSVYLSVCWSWWGAWMFGYWQLPTAFTVPNQLSHANS